MQLHHLLFAQSAVASHFPQIRTAFAAVNDRHQNLPRFRFERIALLPPDLQALDRVPRRLLGISQYHGNVVHTRNGFHHLGMTNQPLG